MTFQDLHRANSPFSNHASLLVWFTEFRLSAQSHNHWCQRETSHLFLAATIVAFLYWPSKSTATMALLPTCLQESPISSPCNIYIYIILYICIYIYINLIYCAVIGSQQPWQPPLPRGYHPRAAQASGNWCGFRISAFHVFNHYRNQWQICSKLNHPKPSNTYITVKQLIHFRCVWHPSAALLRPPGILHFGAGDLGLRA